MVIVKSLILLILINILILTTISNLHKKIFLKLLNTLINCNSKIVDKYLRNMSIFITNKFLKLLSFLLIKILLILIIPFATIIYALFLICIKLANGQNLFREISCKSVELNILDK